GFPGVCLPPVPPERALWSSALSSAEDRRHFARKRAQLLQYFLQAIADHPFLRADHALLYFVDETRAPVFQPDQVSIGGGIGGVAGGGGPSSAGPRGRSASASGRGGGGGPVASQALVVKSKSKPRSSVKGSKRATLKRVTSFKPRQRHQP